MTAEHNASFVGELESAAILAVIDQGLQSAVDAESSLKILAQRFKTRDRALVLFHRFAVITAKRNYVAQGSRALRRDGRIIQLLRDPAADLGQPLRSLQV